MTTSEKKILIIDEAGFSRICSAILEKEGYGTCSFSDLQNTMPDYGDVGLIVASYPFVGGLLEKLKRIKIPMIILSDRLNRDLAMALENFDKSSSYCMIKPLDYTKFRNLVRQIMRREDNGAVQAGIGTAIQREISIKMQTEQ
jgi:DNA-binding NtrC family response regulator